VEKSTADAQVFYKNKVDSIQQNIIDLEKIITQKSQNVRVVEEGSSLWFLIGLYISTDIYGVVLRQKMLGGVGGSGVAPGSSA